MSQNASESFHLAQGSAKHFFPYIRMLSVCNKRVTYGDTDTYKHYYYTLYSISVFSLTKSLQLFLEITATYRLISYLLADS